MTLLDNEIKNDGEKCNFLSSVHNRKSPDKAEKTFTLEPVSFVIPFLPTLIRGILHTILFVQLRDYVILRVSRRDSVAVAVRLRVQLP